MVDNNHPPRGRHVHSGPIVAALALLGIVFVFFVFGSSTDQPWGDIAFLLGVPFGVGMLVGENVDRQRAMGCFVWPTIAICGLLFLAYLIFGEGVLCIAIVLPLWISAAIGGALTSLWVHGRYKPGEGEADDGESRLRMAAWTILPSFLIAIEIFAPPTWSEHEVVREVIVKATPAQVWPQLAQIRHVRPKEGRWTFTHDILGIPRPVDARLEHDKDGLVRKARWGEGIHFNERIVTQDTDRAMQWRFIFPDKSLQNHTDRHIAPDGETLHILSGGYRLDPLQDGRTRIRLSTRYAMRTQLPRYMAWWADLLLGDVQTNVLTIIAQRSHSQPIPPRDVP